MPKKNTGKLLERLVNIIESSLNDRTEFQVTPDIKLEDQFGNKRQIDVLIEYKASQRFDFKIDTSNIFEIDVAYKLLKSTILLGEADTYHLEKNQKLSEFYHSVLDKKLTIRELFSQYMNMTKKIFLDQQALYMNKYGPAVLDKRYQVEVEFNLEKEGVYTLVNEDRIHIKGIRGLVEIFYTQKKLDDIQSSRYESIQSGDIISDVVTLNLSSKEDGNNNALSIVNNLSSKDFKVYFSKKSEIEEIKLIPLKINTTSGDH